VGARRPRAVVLDAGALVAFERNDRRVRTLVELAVAHRGALHVSACVVAQVWRDGRRQARIARLIGSGALDVWPLDLDEAQATGVLCGVSASRDIVDAHVVLLARQHGAVIVTSDPDDLKRIDAGVELVVC
jgi:predicted nucleic acid-binding protein